jgi:serine/threonine-protein kinase RIO1
MASSITVATTRVLDWNALAQRITLDVIDTVNDHVTLMNLRRLANNAAMRAASCELKTHQPSHMR